MMIEHLKTAARILGGDVSGHQVLCPGPGHSKDDRSLSVRFDLRAPDGFVVHSFAGDCWRDCRDHVKAKLDIECGSQDCTTTGRADETTTSNMRRARALWSEARSVNGTLAERYLLSRGLCQSDAWSLLRFHPSCPFKGKRVPALLSPMSHAITGELQGIQRTRLDVKDRAMLGSSKDAVVRLSTPDDVSDTHNICEGVETGLALLAMGIDPVWCTLSASGLANLPVLADVQSLVIYADHDLNGTGEQAAVKCAQRWQASGCRITIVKPTKADTDFADFGRPLR